MSEIYPLLLAGGSGTRLWPLSRKSYPKQFSRIIDGLTLFQSSAQRLVSSDIIQFAPHITLTNSDFRFIVGEQLQEVGLDPGAVLIEPEVKNTAAAILSASLFVYSNDNDAVILVAPSDHLIPDKNNFHEIVKIGLSYAKVGKIVTFGIKPTHPETGYGYQRLSQEALDLHGTAEIKNFVEKPSVEDARKMFADENFLWNAGIFLFRARDMIEAFKIFAPKTLKLVSDALDGSRTDLGFVRLAGGPWSELENISIDYAIMEKARNLVSVPYKSKWSDLGGWDAVWSEGNQNASGNVLSGAAHAIDCSNSLIRSESKNQQIVGIGLDEIMAIAMPDAVLVAHKERAQEVKNAVALLKTQNIPQAENFPKDHRPWGWFESLVLGDCFQVKRICVKPGEALSLQSHNYRSEHWIVVKGAATVTIDDEVKLITEGQSIYVPLGAKHRMENSGQTLMVLIEVQIGSYLGEDDIIRYDDRYNRNSLDF